VAAIDVDVSEDDLGTFVGTRRDYYLSAWRPLRTCESHVGRFNGAAFFLTGSWLFFRRLYGMAVLVVLFALVEGTLSQVLFQWLGLEGTATIYGWLRAPVYMLLIGLLGNRWYYHHAVRQIRAARSRGAVSEQELAAHGGTDWPAAIVGTLISGLALSIVGEIINRAA